MRCATGGGPEPNSILSYINDLPLDYDHKKNRYSLLYAYDLMYLACFKKSKKNVEKNLNNYLKKLQLWSQRWRLKFAPHKSSYTVFERCKRTQTDLDLKMNGAPITKCNEPKFLGFVYDKYLSGRQHVNKVKKTCNSRMNILRVLVHKSWHMKEKILVQLYKSLIRSHIEYMGLNFHCLKPSLKNELQSIQNNSLRAIFKKDRETSGKELQELAKVDSIRKRMIFLNDKYLHKSECIPNPIISDMIEEHLNEIETDRVGGIMINTSILSKNKYIKQSLRDTGIIT